MHSRPSLIRTGSSTAVTTNGMGGNRKSYLKQTGPGKESVDRRNLLKEKLSFLDQYGTDSDDDINFTGPGLGSPSSTHQRKTTSGNHVNRHDKKPHRRRHDKDNLSISDHGPCLFRQKESPKSTTSKSGRKALRRHKSLGQPPHMASKTATSASETTKKPSADKTTRSCQPPPPPPTNDMSPNLTRAPRRTSSYGVLNSFLDNQTSSAPSHTGDAQTVADPSNVGKTTRRNSSYGVLNSYLDQQASAGRDAHKVTDVSSVVSSNTHKKSKLRRNSSFGLFGGRGNSSSKNEAGGKNAEWNNNSNVATSERGERTCGSSGSSNNADSQQPRRRLSLGPLGGRFKSRADAASSGSSPKAKHRKTPRKTKSMSSTNSKKPLRRTSSSVSQGGMVDFSNSDRDSDDYTSTTQSLSSNSTMSPNLNGGCETTDESYLRKAKERQAQLRREQQQQQLDQGGSLHRRSIVGADINPSQGAPAFTKPKKVFDDSGFVSDEESDIDSDSDDDHDDDEDDGPSMLTRGLQVLERLYDDLNV